jgi:50S ribosomal protein L16 3-hydroxylase
MSGRRRWRISEQKDLSLNPDLPLKILKRFQVEQEWVLEPGDMLYLPPHIAHDGIALDAGCQTWSVGFRAQSYKEILQEGLWRLAESLEDIPELEKRFADPKQTATSQAEQLPEELIKQVAQKLNSLNLDRIETFLPGVAAYLSEPKPQAYFDGSAHDLPPEELRIKLKRQAIKPHPQTRLLALGTRIYCNGEDVTTGQDGSIKRVWRALASKKQFKGSIGKIEAKNTFFEAFEAGWLVF